MEKTETSRFLGFFRRAMDALLLLWKTLEFFVKHARITSIDVDCEKR